MKSFPSATSGSVALALAENGSVFVVGDFTGTINLGGDPIKQGEPCGLCGNTTDAFLAGFDENGAHLWSKAIGFGGSVHIRSVKSSPDGSLYSSLWETQPYVPDGTFYFSRYDTDGNPLPQATFPYQATLYCPARLEFDAASNVYLAEGCGPNAKLRKFAAESTSWDAELCDDPSCLLLWEADISDVSRYFVDGPGNVYLLTNWADRPKVLQKLDTNGVEQWKITFGQTGAVLNLTVDEAGNVYLFRYEDDRRLITRLASNGNVLWSRALPSSGYFGNSLYSQGSGLVTLFGTFQETVSWGPGSMTPVTSNDMFLIQLDSDGRLQTHLSYPGPVADGGSAAAIISCAGDVFVRGRGVADFGAAGSTLGPFIARLPHPLGLPTGDPCTEDDTCILGACVQGVCCDQSCPQPCNACSAASGAVADGVCTPLSNVVCDDGDGCTQVDVCTGGVCISGKAVTCEGEYTCRTCGPGTGVCDQAGPNGVACDDGNACTLQDRCEIGACVPGPARVCPLPDECHEAGTCEPATGHCRFFPKPDGTHCSAGTCKIGVCHPEPAAAPGNAVPGCSCDLRSRRSGYLPWALLGLVALAVGARRRRFPTPQAG